jgi:hypothetical protein
VRAWVYRNIVRIHRYTPNTPRTHKQSVLVESRAREGRNVYKVGELIVHMCMYRFDWLSYAMPHRDVQELVFRKPKLRPDASGLDGTLERMRTHTHPCTHSPLSSLITHTPLSLTDVCSFPCSQGCGETGRHLRTGDRLRLYAGGRGGAGPALHILDV